MDSKCLSDREIAKIIYDKQKEKSLADIARILNKPQGTIRSWKHSDNWDNAPRAKIKKTSNRYKAMEIYFDNYREIAISEIAKSLGEEDGTVRSWKHRDEWDKKYAEDPELQKRECAKKELEEFASEYTETIIDYTIQSIGEIERGVKKLKDSSDNLKVDISKPILETIEGYIAANTESKSSLMVADIIINTLKQSVLSKIRDREYISEDTRYSILQRAGFKCQACGAKPSSTNNVTLHIDHVIPHSLGGSNNPKNLQVLCMECNISKGNRFNDNHNM